ASLPIPVVLLDHVDVAPFPDPHDVLLVEPSDLGAVRVTKDIVPDAGVLRERIAFKRERFRLDVLELEPTVGSAQDDRPILHEDRMGCSPGRGGRWATKS